MSIRVRFAPSPTGFLHIGGARTALFNYLFGKAKKGTFVLRIEDTDLERSTKEFERSVIEDLKWLGLTCDEGPENPGEFGPYRQSERIHLYKKYADQLLEQGKAFYCFCTDEELKAKGDKAKAESGDVRYDGTCYGISIAEARKRIANGEKAAVRFKVPNKEYSFFDLVRGEITFPADMVGDFVLLRSSNLPIYNYGCVIDDWLMKITHVIRGEDHVNNTLRQLMLYEALGAPLPQFAHVSMILGADRQKLSKRHGATSVWNYRDESFLPEAIVNFLSLLGWSHPQEKDIFKLEELFPFFDLDRFTKSPAVFDFEKLRWMNGQHLRALAPEKRWEAITPFVKKENQYHKESKEWQFAVCELFIDKIDIMSEINNHLDAMFSSKMEITDAVKEIWKAPEIPGIKEYLKKEVNDLFLANKKNVSAEDFERWSNYIKKDLKVKGKSFFMGMRTILTGSEHGADLKLLIPLTPLTIIKERLDQI